MDSAAQAARGAASASARRAPSWQATALLAFAALPLFYFNAAFITSWVPLRGRTPPRQEQQPAAAAAAATSAEGSVGDAGASGAAADYILRPEDVAGWDELGHGDDGELAFLADWVPPSDGEVSRRCAATAGGWCGPQLQQIPVKWRAPPLGTKTCMWNCEHGAGVGWVRGVGGTVWVGGWGRQPGAAARSLIACRQLDRSLAWRGEVRRGEVRRGAAA